MQYQLAQLKENERKEKLVSYAKIGREKIFFLLLTESGVPTCID